MKPDTIILACALLALAACAEEAPETPLGTPQQLMANHVQPAADIYWGSVKYESELMPDGTVEERDIRPQTDAEWEAVRASAERLGELGEVLGSPAYTYGRGADWHAYAQGLVDAAARAEAAAVAKDPEAVFAEGGTVYNVCRACHQMYPPEVLPEGMTVDDLAES
ncbi:MAG: cytochrome c [Erythrobacter sp.]|nr:MAG: cytochrome c [Erythrobacter sp.]